jgi:hypothetical protein
MIFCGGNMPELHVSKKNISKLFSEMQNRKFIIPEFQRPYKWDIELCETLWNDIEDFAVNDAVSGSDYFLGTIVSYQNENKHLEIIDGQQRITSFLLLLRAFYRKLEDMDQNSPDVIGLKNQIAPCIWDVDKISQIVSDKTKIRIQSLVITEDDNKTFHKILETGNFLNTAEDNYSKNFGFFKTKCDEYAKNNPLEWKHLCITILQQCIILPIECDSSETALKIFSTLNDRGLPLADSDVFKAEIYKSIGDVEKRKIFTEDWNELTQLCRQANIVIDDVFRYCMHIIRARHNDNSKEVGLRKFYAASKYIYLRASELMNELLILANFWLNVNARKEPSFDDGYTISLDARKYLHCLEWYPNEYWKYPVSVFFLKNRTIDTFNEDLCILLKKLISILFFKFIFTPSINAIRDDIYNAYISIQKMVQWETNISINDEIFFKRMTDEFTSPKISRALILLDAYLNPDQNVLIPETFDIEHIFPKKWQDTNYNGWDYNDAQIYLEHFGNKIVLERKLNIQAGNGYFGIKKGRYAKSKIATILELSKLSQNDWLKEDIENRDKKFILEILSFMKKNIV